MKTVFKNFLKSTLILAMSALSVVPMLGQEMPNVIPPSPEAASIVGYGNTGVNFYTGSPSLSIPIHTASSKGYSLPVSLSYSGFGGIKVEQIAPWVGLGWSLNAGGVVSRTVRGRADDLGGGYQALAALPNLSSSTIALYQDYADGDLDAEPDEYNYNAGGMSGTFYINKSKQVVEKVKSNAKITPIFAGNVVTRFEITSASGTVYVFAEQERSKSFEVGENQAAISYYTSSWYLTQVKNQDGYSLMTLTYHDWSGTTNQLKNVSYYPLSELPLGVWFGPQHMRKSWSYTEAKRIKEISFDHGKILFNRSTVKRQDHLNDYRLDNIEVKDENNVLVKKFQFYYSYFTPTGTASINSSTTNITFQGLNTGDFERRLRLDEVKEFGNDGVTSNPGHVFTYNTNYYLPSRYSFAQDHWGYYNGKTGNTSPEPFQTVSYYDGWSILRTASMGTADRDPSASHAQAGVLTKVTYPTGGHTAFTFEGHVAYDPSSSSNKNVGGLRVDAIVDHDGIDASNDVRREYYYNLNGDNGSSNSTGYVVNEPKYGGQEVLNLSTSAPNVNMIPNGYRRTIPSTQPLMTTNGAEVGYGKVTVRTIGSSNNGKTEYYFTTADDYSDFYDGYYYFPLNGESFLTLGNVTTGRSFPYPRVDSRDYIRGLLTKQIDYRWTGSTYHKVKEVENIYAGTYEAPSSNLEPFDTNTYFPSNTVSANYPFNFTSVEGAIWKPGVHNHFKRYRIYSGRVDLQKTITKTYNLGSNSTQFTTETTNFWDDLSTNRFQVSRTQTKDSENNTHETRYYYPYDQSSLSGLTTTERNNLNAMVSSKNMLGTVVQQEQYRGSTKLSTTRTNFGNYSGYYLPSSIEAAKGTGSLETRVTFHQYDSHGNLLGVSKDGGAQQRYIYGYDNQLPTAQVVGATSNSHIGYSSFEQNGHGNLLYSGPSYTDANAPSGTKYYRLSTGSIQKTGLSSGITYRVSYYAKSGTVYVNGSTISSSGTFLNANGWRYYEKTFSGVSSITIGGSAYIDEVRIYPADAQMTTYTYSPMYGVTSQVDANHIAVKYQYDKFGRLELVKDLDGKVLQAYQYKYQATTSN
ncbi:RHS repeat domain-containing protein [Roseivirga misakiensis]|uniref:YD repeat-containing protein n=1 Tax=Roseivirga misakiensis TaxID=1563681 RepID=A0A1E5T335_9BACT|nr:hypothetical protein [Roseivirga misakiensis]OEK05798.1 hypothetical protein BFP71_06675 [Roseivirga misakiensis]